MWLLVIASIEVGLLEQFCYSSRGLLVAHCWAGRLWYDPPVRSRVTTCRRVESISSARCLWCWGGGCLTGKRHVAIRGPVDWLSVTLLLQCMLPDRPSPAWLSEMGSMAFRWQLCCSPGCLTCKHPSGYLISRRSCFSGSADGVQLA